MTPSDTTSAIAALCGSDCPTRSLRTAGSGSMVGAGHSLLWAVCLSVSQSVCLPASVCVCVCERERERERERGGQTGRQTDRDRDRVR